MWEKNKLKGQSALLSLFPRQRLSVVIGEVGVAYWHFWCYTSLLFHFYLRPKQLTTFFCFVCLSHVQICWIQSVFPFIWTAVCVWKHDQSIMLWMAEEIPMLQMLQWSWSRRYSGGPVSCIYWQMLLAIWNISYFTTSLCKGFILKCKIEPVHFDHFNSAVYYLIFKTKKQQMYWSDVL